MKVWILNYFVYGDVSVFSESTDIAALPVVQTELQYLLDADLNEEYEDFIVDANAVLARGWGEATIEERLRVELMEVTHVDVE